MKGFQERKAEVLRRSACAIKERRKRVKACILLGTFIIICCTSVAGASIMPFLRMNNGSLNVSMPQQSDDSSGRNDSIIKPAISGDVGMEGIITSALPDFSEPDETVKNIQVTFTQASDGPTYSKTQEITDPEKAWEVYEIISSVINNNETADGTRGEITINVMIGGEKSTYYLNESTLEYNGMCNSVSNIQWEKLKDLLGI